MGFLKDGPEAQYLYASMLHASAIEAVREERQQKYQYRRSQDAGQKRNTGQAGAHRTDHAAAYPGADDADNCRCQKSAGDAARYQSFSKIGAGCGDEKEKNKAKNAHGDLQSPLELFVFSMAAYILSNFVGQPL